MSSHSSKASEKGSEDIGGPSSGSGAGSGFAGGSGIFGTAGTTGAGAGQGFLRGGTGAVSRTAVRLTGGARGDLPTFFLTVGLRPALVPAFFARGADGGEVSGRMGCFP